MRLIKRYFLATRPAFLTITLLGCLIGLFGANSLSGSRWSTNLLAAVIVLLVHASANVLNDYFDHLNGSDSINVDRISPFTGGSRYIQNNIFSPKQIFGFGLLLLTLSAILGLYLCYISTWMLLAIGIAGVIIGWSYSAPPLQLMSRGLLGEIAIAIAWSLVVIGFSALQTDRIDAQLIPIGISYGLMVANILFLNQVPDIKADKASKKNTLAAQSLPQDLWKWYTLFFVSAYGLQILAVYCLLTPVFTLLSILIMPLFIHCSIELKRRALDRSKLAIIIPRNILGVHLYALLMCVGLYWG